MSLVSDGQKSHGVSGATEEQYRDRHAAAHHDVRQLLKALGVNTFKFSCDGRSSALILFQKEADKFGWPRHQVFATPEEAVIFLRRACRSDTALQRTAERISGEFPAITARVEGADSGSRLVVHIPRDSDTNKPEQVLEVDDVSKLMELYPALQQASL